MKKLYRALIVIFFVYAVVMGLMALQYFFDRGDLRKAIHVIYEYKPTQSTKTLIQLMSDKNSVSTNQMHCEAQMASRYEGRVYIECGKQEGFNKDDDQNNFQWIVNVVAGQIQAKNEKAHNLMDEISSLK